MSIELPDWLRGTLLLGRDGAGNIIPILIDAAGQINVLLRGVDALGTVRTVRVDNLGQLYAIMRGAGGNDVSVDAAGNLAAILKGIDGLGNLRTLLVDATGQAIMVPRGASGNYLDVDAFGYLTAVLKGMGIGGLTTIAVDADGRIESFLVDAEDQWGTTVVTGNAGLAAKLGSLQNWDYRGQVYYQTGFDQGVAPWLKYPAGTGSAITIDPTMWLSDGYSLKMVAGSDGTHDACIASIIQRQPTGRVGLEVVWSKDGTTGYVTIEIRPYIGGRVWKGILRYSNVDNRMEYWTAGGAWAFWGNPYIVSTKEAFNRMKLVIDVGTKKYVRALWAQTEQSMAGLGLFDAGAGFLAGMYVYFTNTGRLANNDVVYLDRVILTSGEPA